MSMSEKQSLSWTHENLQIADIRKSKSLYVIKLDNKIFEHILFIEDKIFEERMASYFLDVNWTRKDIFSVNWNFLITKGYFIKIKDNNIEKIETQNCDKYYVSFLEIAGPLGTIKSIHPKN
jgi:hypothetical protein